MQLCTLPEEIHDRRLSVGWIRCRISVDLPRAPGGCPPVRRHPLFDRDVRLVDAAVRPAVDGDGCFARWGDDRGHFAHGLKCPRHFDAEVARDRPTWLLRMVVEEDVVTISPEARVAADELPDLVQCGSPCRGNAARRNLATHRR